MPDYNGWSNRETWNANLHLSNDEKLYHATNAIVAEPKTVEQAAKDIRNFCRQLWGTKTPDGDRLALVDWQELVTSWRSP